MRFIAKKIEDTLKFSRKVAKNIQSGETIFLIGELGAGKTTMIQAIAKELGVKEKIVSPTFNIYKIYPLTKNNGHLIHIDAYRLGKNSQSILEDFRTDNNIKMIEWPERINIFGKCKTIKIKYTDKENERIIDCDFIN